MNNKVSEVISKLFNERLRLKAEKNCGQAIIKLVMNTAYGKNGQKAIDIQQDYISHDSINAWMHNHHEHIESIQIMPNGQFKCKTYRPINRDFNRQHISVMVLSFSKRLMNQVVNLIPPESLHYTDTDSLHIDSKVISFITS